MHGKRRGEICVEWIIFALVDDERTGRENMERSIGSASGTSNSPLLLNPDVN